MILTKLRQMWNNLLLSISNKLAKNATRKKPTEQEYTDIFNINWLAMAVSKLTNLACNEATFEVTTDSTLAEPIVDRCANIEDNRFEICNGMLSGGDYWVIPEIDIKDGNINISHTYLSSDWVSIIDSHEDKITELYMVVDYYQPNENTTYFLQRRHKLDNGTLTISYATVDTQGKETPVDYWRDIKDVVLTIHNAVNIGVGRYKSPVSSRGISQVYGVPLTFGCNDIIKTLNDDIKLINDEFKNAKSKIFADPRILMTKSEQSEYIIPENIFAVKKMAGDNGSMIDIFNPAIRSSEHYEKLQTDFALLEKQIGLSRGIFTDNAATETATATAVRRSNSDTMSMLNNIHNALDNGNKMTLEADSMYLNIRSDLWEYNSDYFDPFADESEQWQRKIQLAEKGAMSKASLLKWDNPSLTDEQIADELAQAEAEQTASTQNALKSALNF